MKKAVPTVGGLMVIGLGVGMALGSAMDNMPVSLTLGLVLGLIAGFGVDMNRQTQTTEAEPDEGDPE